jgi:hypothetical protein
MQSRKILQLHWFPDNNSICCSCKWWTGNYFRSSNSLINETTVTLCDQYYEADEADHDEKHQHFNWVSVVNTFINCSCLFRKEKMYLSLREKVVVTDSVLVVSLYTVVGEKQLLLWPNKKGTFEFFDNVNNRVENLTSTKMVIRNKSP